MNEHQTKGFNNGRKELKAKSKTSNYLTFMIGILIVVGICAYADAQLTGNRTTEQTNTGSYSAISIEYGSGKIESREKTNTTTVSTVKEVGQGVGTKDIKTTPTNQDNTEYSLKEVDCDAINIQGKYGVEQTERAKYYCSLNPEQKMLAAFFQESGYNPNALGWAGEKGVCQLMQNKTNNVRINDPRWSDWKRQAQKCVEKYLAVPVQNRGTIRSSIGSKAYKKYLYMFPLK